MTSYHPSIPQSTDDPSVSQSDLLDNFSSINTQYQVNHVPLTAGGNNGYHTQVWFNNVLATDPDLTAPQSSVYTKNISGTNELFFQNTDVFTGVDQLTNLLVANGTITGAAQTNPGLITSPLHGLANGNMVTIYNVYGMTQLNKNTYTITVVNANQFTIGVDATGFTAYVGGGYWTSVSVTKYGIISPWGIIFNMGSVASGVTTINYAIPFPNGTILTALLTPIGTGGPGAPSYTIATISASTLTFNTSVPRGYTYLVIGQ